MQTGILQGHSLEGMRIKTLAWGSYPPHFLDWGWFEHSYFRGSEVGITTYCPGTQYLCLVPKWWVGGADLQDAEGGKEQGCQEQQVREGVRVPW